MTRNRGNRALAALALAALVAGCATTGDRAPSKADPFEPFNRAMYAIHEPIDTNIVRPIAQAWVDYVPTPVQSAVRTFFGNIEDGFSAFNGLLQGKWEKAGNDLGRLTVNVWGFGVVDIASQAGIPKGDEDFGQTFGYWGIPQGPYLFIPLWGPSTVRDGTGSILRYWYTPTQLIPDVAVRNVIYGIGAIDARAQALGATSLLEQASIDPYTFVRRSYLQRREYLVYDGKPPPEKEEE